MFWNQVAGIYDIFANLLNRSVHQELIRLAAAQIHESDIVLECACGTGMLSKPIALKCKKLTATDFSEKMLEQAQRKCSACTNIEFRKADILELPFADSLFDVVVAANVIHLLDEPVMAMNELSRVCKPGGTLIIPTYMNRKSNGKSSSFASVIGKAGADFKRQFTFETYQQFFAEMGFCGGEYTMINGLVPCAVAILENAKH